MMSRQQHEQLIQNLFRLLRLGNMHDVNNQAIERSIDQALPLLHSHISKHEGTLTFLFAGPHIFIGGQPLNASKSVYEQAQTLGALFEKIGGNELVLDDALGEATIRALVERSKQANNSPSPLNETNFPNGAKLNRIQASLFVGLQDDEHIDPQEHVLRLCTSTLVVMDRLYEGTRKGDYSLVRHVKRLARDLVLLAQAHPNALLSFLNTSSNRADAAMFSVKGAILSILTAQQLTQDLRNLSDLAMTALLFDAGNIRAAGMLKHARRRGMEFAPNLSEDAADRLPEATATMMAMFGQLNESSLSRSVYSYESHYIQRRHTRGFPYNGQLAPTIEALIIAVVRRYLSLTALDLQREDAEYTTDEALGVLFDEAHSKLEQIILQLFTIAAGVFRPGSAVCLSSGAKAIVQRNHEKIALYSRPKVLLVYGADGQHFDPPTPIDLSHLHPDILKLGCIVGPLSSDDAAILRAQSQVRKTRQAPEQKTGEVVSLAELAGDVLKIPLPSAPVMASRPNVIPATVNDIIIPSGLQENSIWQIETPDIEIEAIEEPPVYEISIAQIHGISEAIEDDELPELGISQTMLEPADILSSVPMNTPIEELKEVQVEPLEMIEIHDIEPLDQPVALPSASSIESAPPFKSETSKLGSAPSAREGMVNVSDLAHLFPASFSEIDSPLPSRQSYLDAPADLAPLISSPQTWDSTLDDDAPSKRSDLGVLDADEIEEHLLIETEATTLLPRNVIATFQFTDKKFHTPEPTSSQPADENDH